MGYYIETPEHLNKARQLHELYDAQPELPDEFNFDSDKALICVVENGPFDAAGVAFDAMERDVFNAPHDHRPKTWWSLPKSVVKTLCPNVPF